ncbi:MAG: hypothetical protein MRY79_03400 [Alphaproteobacteria bacterium]|nr:hypothetical protein [Alphaproteobacteria bacterium]
MMFENSFHEIEIPKAGDILDKLNPELDGAQFDLSTARLIATDLAFYNGYQLMEVRDHDTEPPRNISFIYEGEGRAVHILNGTNDAIYALNRLVPIALDDQTIKDYVRFFFHYVQGRHGRFVIVEGTEEINWREEPTLSAKRALGKMIEPLEVQDISEEGVYTLKASIIFKDTLFESLISVNKEGLVNLHNQELLVEDIPVVDEQFMT